MKVTRKTYDEVMMPCYVPQDMLLTYGQGCYLYDSDGNKYLDMTAGIAVNCLGHNHKVVVKTIKKQACRLLHVSNVFVNDKTLTLAQKLVDLTGYERVFFVNSGAEANEAALKLARRVAYDNYGEDKNEIISFNHSFHGRTFFSVSVGGQEKYYQGFGPIPGGITHLPFNDLDSFKKTVSNKTCAVILEVVQGEGGILEIDPIFLKGVRELCTKHNALLIFDEVQTGIGRLGTFYGYEQVGVKPDILTSAKGLASGVPIGAVLTYDHIGQHFKPGTHGSTFGGNPLACSVGCKVVDIVSDQTFLDKVRSNGEYLRKQLRKLNKKYQIFADIRGKGLLVGAQLAAPYDKEISLFQKLCTKHKLLVLLAGYDVVRFAPPLIIKKSQIREAMKLLESTITNFLDILKLNSIFAKSESLNSKSHDNKAKLENKDLKCQDEQILVKDNVDNNKSLSADNSPNKAKVENQDAELVNEQEIALTKEVISSFDSLESLAYALDPDNAQDHKVASKPSISEQAINDYMDQLLNEDDSVINNLSDSKEPLVKSNNETKSVKLNHSATSDETLEDDSVDKDNKKSTTVKTKKCRAKRK